jgi:hypothetical protein
VQNPENKMSRPTDSAKSYFEQADQFIGKAGLRLSAAKPTEADQARHDSELDLWRGLWMTNKGLIELSTGLRATYILLEDIQRKLARHDPLS